MKHLFNPCSQQCIVCAKTRIEIEELDLKCQGTIKYREYLIGSHWVKSPILEPFK